MADVEMATVRREAQTIGFRLFMTILLVDYNS